MSYRIGGFILVQLSFHYTTSRLKSLLLGIGTACEIDKNCENQYSETNVMHFFIHLLRIKDLYMFRALLAHPQEVLYKW
jgi:hypothetical protein